MLAGFDTLPLHPLATSALRTSGWANIYGVRIFWVHRQFARDGSRPLTLKDFVVSGKVDPGEPAPR
jgi:hypothetical protein